MSLSLDISKKISLSELEKQFKDFGDCSFMVVDDKPIAEFTNKADAVNAKKAIDAGKIEGIEARWNDNKGIPQPKKESEDMKKIV
jgi:hypothetical protein